MTTEVEDVVKEINQLIRLGQVREAVELTAKDATSTIARVGLCTYSEMLKKTPNARRMAYCAALKVAANNMIAFADAIVEEAKKHV